MTTSWTWYERDGRRRWVPKPQQGVGVFTPNEPPEDKNLIKDEKTGLLLPESAARERRKVKIGFQP